MADTKSTSGLVENRTIDWVPPNERHGTPFSQFTLWFGSNTQITAIVDGALAIAVFKSDALWAIIALLIVERSWRCTRRRAPRSVCRR